MSIFKRGEGADTMDLPVPVPEAEPVFRHEAFADTYPNDVKPQVELPAPPVVAADEHGTFEQYVAENYVDAPTAAAVKAYHGWGSGKRLSDLEFSNAVDKVNNIPFGETPYEAPSDEPPVKD